MRKYLQIILLIGILVLSSKLYSQADRDKVELLRIGFITKKLELNTTESEKFWPVYNEYNDKVKTIKKNLRLNFKSKGESLSDADADELYRLEIQSRQAELDLFKQYGEKIRIIIGAKKFTKLRMAEEEFKREIINSIREKSDGS